MEITEKDISGAIESWGAGLIKVSQAYENGGFEKARDTADYMLDKLYGFHLGPVLFKPTLSGGHQTFRQTKEGALSYFVGHNSDFPGDTGFGIKYWREVKPETAALFIDGTVAMWMGWVTFLDKNNQATKVDKSWGYKCDKDGELKIILHHSSLPYNP
jgi:hypothetical protein